MRLFRLTHWTFAIALTMAPWRLAADNITLVPPSLNPGDTYRLVFVTSTSTQALHTDIGYYNNFVTSVANSVPALASLGATWTAIGSAADGTSAAANIGASPSTVGVFRLDGGLVANGVGTWAGGLFSGNLLQPIDCNELGSVVSTYVFTGSHADGSTFNALGRQQGVEQGYASTSWTPNGGNGSATFRAFDIGWGTFNSDSYPLYAASSELTVPAPEPASTGLFLVAGTVLLGMRRRGTAPPHLAQF